MDVREKVTNGKRLIDADALISYMDECSKESRFRVYYGYAKSFIDDAPTVDAVPVVRCGKCKHFRPYEGEEHKGDCAELVGLESCVYKDDFCNYGERRGDNDD